MEEKVYFKKEKEFIKSLVNTTGRLYCVIDYKDHLTLTPERLFSSKRFKVDYLDSSYVGGNMNHIESIFKNDSGFFIYLSRMDFESTYKIKIIYEVSQLDEVTLFIKNLSKLN
jgi:hypothetical protein